MLTDWRVMWHNTGMAKNKTEQQLRDDLLAKKRKEFLEKCNEVLQPIFDEYSMRLVPVIYNNSTEYKVHYEAGFAVQSFTKEEIKVQKGNETLDTKPETNERADSDNQAPA
jgi:hypothetical protein